MATTQIKDLTELTTPAAADVVLVEDASDSDASRKVTLANLVKGFQATAVADANQTISGSYTQSEVQALSDKVDELLGALRTAGLIAT